MPLPIPVFLYHRVGTDADLFTVDPLVYASHLALIAASGRTPLTVTDLAQALRGERELPEAPVCLTFDDGYLDSRATIESAAALGVKSTLYVTTGTIDTPGAVTRADLRALAADIEYVELGAHTVTHPRLDELRGEAAEREITESRDALADLTGSPVRSFAYPHGAHSARVRQLVIEAGFESAAAVKNALSHNGDDPWAIARVTVTRETSRSQIAALLRGEGAPLAWGEDRLSTRGYRLLRTVRRRLRDAGPTPPRQEFHAQPGALRSEGIATDVHAPIAVAHLDLDSAEPQHRLTERDDGKPYNAVAVLVRDHKVPVAWTVVPAPSSGVLSIANLPPEFRVARVAPPAIAAATASRISVVITTCADSSTTASCVRALLASDEPPAEIIVVDNRPNGSPVRAEIDRLFCAGSVPVRYVAEPRPGLAVARNAGLAAARSEFVAFTDDDVTVDRHWLTALRRSFALHPELSCVTGLILPLELETEAQVDFERFASLSKGLIPRLYSLAAPPPNMPLFPYAAGHFGSGANAAFRRSTLVEIGGFDQLLGTGTRTHGGEDLDIFIRVLAAGHNVAYDPAAVVWHRHPANAGGMSQRTLSYGIGFGAVTGKLLMSNDHRGQILRLAPKALSYWFREDSRKNAGRRTGAAARQAHRRETLGVALGPGAYLTSWLLAQLHRSPASAVADRGPSIRLTAPAVCTPLWSGQLELRSPSLPTQLTQAGGQPFAVARLLVLAAGTPLGFVQIDTPCGTPDLAAAIELARSTFGERVEQAIAEQAWSRAGGPLISVVLCTHDRAAGARRTLESLRALAYENFEVIVVDNAPSDDSTEMAVKELQEVDSRIRYVAEPVKGLSRARNRGLAEATGELIAFTDDDVRADPLWLRGLLRGFGRRDDVACVTGLVATSSLEHPAEQYFDRRVWWASECEPKVHTSAPGPGDSILHPYAAGTFGTGANFACRVAVLRALGGFDQCLGAGSPTQGGEDLDIFVRLLRAGHALSYEPSAFVWHEHRVDDESLRKQMYGYGLGLTAYLTKYALSRASRAEVARRALSGIGHAAMLIRRSRGASAESSLHSGLVGAEVRGMLNGPLAYLRARRSQDREHLRSVSP